MIDRMMTDRQVIQMDGYKECLHICKEKYEKTFSSSLFLFSEVSAVSVNIFCGNTISQQK
jgi:hypothetical protein